MIQNRTHVTFRNLGVD